MGVYSTMYITRADAVAEILKHLAAASDEEIGEVLFDLACSGERKLWNFLVIDSYEDRDGRPTYKEQGPL